MKRTIVSLALASALATGLVLFRDVISSAVPPSLRWQPALSAAPRGLPADSVLAIKPGTPSAPRHGETARGQLTAVMQEYARARNYDALYKDLKSRTERNGDEDWVLAQVLKACAKVTERAAGNASRWKLGGKDSRDRFLASISEKDPNRSRRIAAFDEINTDMCGGLADMEVSEKDIRALHERAAALGDPKARASLILDDLQNAMRGPDGKRQFNPQDLPRITEEQLATAKSLFASNDPYAMLEAERVLTFPLANLSLRGGSAERPVDGGALYQGTLLAACELGYPCSRDENRMLINACAMNGRCEARDYREYLFFYGQTPSTSQLMGEYSDAIALARRGDWSYFTFHRGPSAVFAAYENR